MQITTLRQDLTDISDAQKERPGSEGHPAGGEERSSVVWMRDPNSFCTRDLVWLCLDLGIDFYRILALVLKGEWERFILPSTGLRDPDELVEHPECERIVQTGKAGFSPDVSLIFELLERAGGLVSEAGYTRDAFEALVHEMVTADIYLGSVNGRELEEFSERSRTTQAMLREGSEEQKATYWKMECEWLQLHDELGDMLLGLERRRLANARIEQDFLRDFGEVFVALREAIGRLEILQKKVALLEADPELSLEELERMLAEEEKEKKESLDALRFQVEVAMYPRLRMPTGGRVVSDEEFALFCADSKKALREIWLLLHPDRLMHNPAYDRLTPAQREELSELWERSMRIKDEELLLDHEQAGHGFRELHVLYEILERVKKILAHAGIDTAVDLIPQGTTLPERIEWLEKEVARLEREIVMVRAQFKLIIEDEEIRWKAALLRCTPEQRENAKTEMQSDVEQKRSEGDRLEGYLNRLLEIGSYRGGVS